MVIILNVKVTGSAEIVVTAGSSMDPDIVIADLLGVTVASALSTIFKKGYQLSFVTDRFLVCTKSGKNSSSRHPRSQLRMFLPAPGGSSTLSPSRKVPRRRSRHAKVR